MPATNAQYSDLVRVWNRLNTSFSGLSAYIRGHRGTRDLAPVLEWVQQVQTGLSESPSGEGLINIEHALECIESHCLQMEGLGIYNRPSWSETALRMVREMRGSLKSTVQVHNVVSTPNGAFEHLLSQRAASREKSQAPSKSTTAVVTRSKARLFVGSSVEGLSVANEIQALLDHDAEVTVWHQGVFGPSGGTLESLVQMAPTFDFAVLVLTPDDVVTKRDNSKNAPRDNVLLELGLFIGTLGRERTYFVHPREDMALPSDLAGITPINYDANRSDNNLRAAIGPVATSLRSQLKKLGFRQK